MLKHMSMRTQGGNATKELRESIDELIGDFENHIESNYANLPPKVLRSKLPGSVFVVCDPDKICFFYAPKFENRYLINNIDSAANTDQLIRELSLNFDIDDFAVAIFPRSVLSMHGDARANIISSAVRNHVNQQVEAFKMAERISMFSPIFGPNSYPVQSDLVFVLMPFEGHLTQIYNDIIKESIEKDCEMVCRRADEIKSINPVMKDTWKSICESRFVIADLTGFNANVMYELGITHTVGKETILLYQDVDTEKKFPFDLTHIRRINYKDTAAGGKALRHDLSETIKAMVS